MPRNRSARWYELDKDANYYVQQTCNSDGQTLVNTRFGFLYVLAND